jgi:hypothetical protein
MRYSPSNDTNGDGHGNIVAQPKNPFPRMIEILDKEKGRSGLVDQTYPGDEDDESQD